ncbi:MAG: hypothetical protein E7070_08780 [Bacteroidales bacterium]|nr:hypothetical protein [Bacteroidales bacterium]
MKTKHFLLFYLFTAMMLCAGNARAAVEATEATIDFTKFYLCFNKATTTSTVTLSKVEKPTSTPTLQYSYDATTWNDYTIGTAVGTTSYKVYFRAKTVNATFSTDASNYYKFSTTGSFSLTGSIASLMANPEYAHDIWAANASLYLKQQFPVYYASGIKAIPSTYMFANLFRGCTYLTDVSALDMPSTTLKTGCYYGMFYGCSQITASPELPAKTLVEACYALMFYNCTNLKRVTSSASTFTFISKLSNTTKPTQSWLYNVSSEGTYLGTTTATSRDASSVPTGWTFNPLCITANTAISKVTLAANGSPTALTGLQYSTDGLNWSTYKLATEITLSSAGSPVYFRATTTNQTFSTGSNAYYHFTAIGSIKASGNVMSLYDKTCATTTLTDYAFSHLFYNCTALTSASALKLPATTLTTYCYHSMFAGCTNLTAAPTLPAKNLAPECYWFMFSYCSKLASAPALPATTLAQGCYVRMFEYCTSLTEAPELPATTLPSSCYNFMFTGCSKLSKITVGCTAWASTSTTATASWVSGVASTGTFICPPALPKTTGANYIPTGWVNDTKYLTFTANSASSSVALVKNGSPTALTGLEYTTDCINWNDYVPGSTGTISLANVGSYVSFRAKSTNSTFSTDQDNYYKFTLSGSVAASGSVQSLLNVNATTTSVPAYAFNHLFYYQTALTSAPTMPATSIGKSGYNYMFYNCSGLTKSPELPATSLADSCYFNMFRYCKNITSAPEVLPATTLATACYLSMFDGCSKLVAAPKLPAATLATECYKWMFYNCTALKKVEVSFTEWLSGATNSWLYNAGSDGSLFLCPDDLSTTTRNTSYVPTTWTANPLTFTANTGSATVKITKTGSPTALTGLQYSTNGLNWYTYTPGTTSAIELANAGDKVYFRAANTNSTFCANTSSYYNFVLTGSVAASGNIMSLLDKTCVQTSLPQGAFAMLFNGCSTLTSAPKLPATTIPADGYRGMFLGCSALAKAPALPATTLGTYCYSAMFQDCTSLTEAPALPASVMETGCYQYMFLRCTNLTKAPVLASTSLASWCYRAMFQGCTSLTTAPALPATTLAENCYNAMFQDCTSLTTAPALQATTLANYCCQYMFSGSTSLTSAPALPATTLANYCYQYMFKDCTSLTSAPALPATTLADYCYFNMFNGCTSLTSAPALNATSLKTGCYRAMFIYCSALTQAPALPATTLTKECYRGMFQGTGLTQAPELPATTLAQDCYKYMFFNCQGLTKSPALPAKTLATECYYQMFQGCSNLNEVTAAFTTWTSGATTNWLYGVASTGHFYCPPTLDQTQTGASYIPTGWTSGYDCLTFVANTADSKVALTKTGSPTAVSLETSTDGCTWTDYVPGETGYITLTNANDYVYFRASRADGNSSFSKDLSNYYKFDMSGSIAASGNIMSLVDATCESKTIPNSYAFYDLFFNQTALTSAPKLPATTLTNNCYYYMFNGCSALTVAPELPATTLTSYCYYYMFQNCTSLTAAPELKAENAPQYCYSGMFKGCIKLTEAPELKAKTMQQGCYSSMFYNCTKLTTAPELPATTLANYCYSNMFNTCTSLTEAPELSATTLKGNCYENMFNGCTGLTAAPELPATTLADYCYRYMFQGCTNLEYVPLLRAETLANGCYQQMFYNCSKLDVVRTEMTNASATNATTNWLYGTKTGGTLVCPSTLANADSYKPSNWDVKTYAKTVKLNAKGYSTYSSPVPVAITSGADAYSCTVDFGDHAITCSQNPNKNIMPGQGYLLANEDAPSTTVTFHQIEGIIADDMADVENSLLPTTTWDNDVVPMPANARCYSLSGSTFMHFAGTSFVANKAYFLAPLAVGAAEMRMIFNGHDEAEETLAIDAIEDNVKQEERTYDLQGRPIKGNDVKSLMVRNGKTIVVKR